MHKLGMSSYQRSHMLIRSGVATPNEIRIVKEQMEIIQKQRLRTFQMLRYAKIEEVAASGKRKFQRAIQKIVPQLRQQ